MFVASRRWRPLAAWSRWATGVFRLRGETLEDFEELRAWAVRQGVSVVLPMTERSCLLCNCARGSWEAAGIMVGCGEPAMVMSAFDKAATLDAASACGVAIPPTKLPRSEEECRTAADELGYPLVVKTRFSEALVEGRLIRGGGASYVAGADELLPAIQKNRQGPYWPIVQGFVPGAGKGVSGLADHGRAVGLVAHERLRDVRPSGSGSSLRRTIPLEPRLRAPVERLLARLRWHGPVMVEFRDDGGPDPCLMEVNGRFWGSTQLAVDAGLDVPRVWLELLLGRTIEPVTRYRTDVTLRWLWGDIKRLLTILKGRPAGYPGAYPARLTGLWELMQRQPPGTRLEAWRADDPWPALGEWVQGLWELLELSRAPGKHRIVPDRRAAHSPLMTHTEV